MIAPFWDGVFSKEAFSPPSQCLMTLKVGACTAHKVRGHLFVCFLERGRTTWYFSPFSSQYNNKKHERFNFGVFRNISYLSSKLNSQKILEVEHWNESYSGRAEKYEIQTVLNTSCRNY